MSRVDYQRMLAAHPFHTQRVIDHDTHTVTVGLDNAGTDALIRDFARTGHAWRLIVLGHLLAITPANREPDWQHQVDTHTTAIRRALHQHAATDWLITPNQALTVAEDLTAAAVEPPGCDTPWCNNLTPTDTDRHCTDCAAVAWKTGA